MTPSRSSSAPRTLSIGGATFDLFVHTGSAFLKGQEKDGMITLPIGSKIPVEKVTEMCGGGATNTAVGLQRLGCASHFSGVLGSDQWGEKMLKNLKAESVNTTSVTVVEGETSSFSIILSVASGDRVILYAQGTNAHLHDVTYDREAAKTMDWIYLNHLTEDSCVIQDDIATIFEDTHDRGFTWNPGGCQIAQGVNHKDNHYLLEHTTLLLCNKEEALAFTQTSSIEEALLLLKKIGVRYPCITDGKRGAFGYDGKTLFHCPVIEDVKIIDTTGAGDAFGTGATWALLTGLSLPEALRAGTISATSVISVFGAQPGLLTDTELRKRMKEVQLSVEQVPLVEIENGKWKMENSPPHTPQE